MSVEKFSQKVFGDNSNVGYIDKDLLQKFNEHKVVTLDTFKDYLKNHRHFSAEQIKNYTDLAERMSKLQPEVEGVAVLTKNQIKDVFREGAINMPEFLQNVFSVATQNASTDKYKYVNYEELKDLKEDIVHYVTKLVEKAEKQGKEIDSNTLKKFCRENFIKNTFNWGVGFAVSALFLSTLIPKMQYWITKMTTGQNKFPGTADYSEEKNKKK